MKNFIEQFLYERMKDLSFRILYFWHLEKLNICIKTKKKKKILIAPRLD